MGKTAMQASTYRGAKGNKHIDRSADINYHDTPREEYFSLPYEAIQMDSILLPSTYQGLAVDVIVRVRHGPGSRLGRLQLASEYSLRARPEMNGYPTP